MLKSKPRRGEFDYLLNGNSVHVDPPPPIRGGGPTPRVRVEIEIVDRRQIARRGPDDERGVRFGARVLLIAIILALIALARAHGEERWQENRVGSQTYWYSPTSGVHGQEWNMPDGSVRSTWQDPSGHVTDCVVQTFGSGSGAVISRRCH